MSDEKKDIDKDFDDELSQLVHKKSRKRVKNNIYERFISRVQSAEGDTKENGAKLKPLSSANKLPAFEPLSAKELQLFEDKNSDNDQESQHTTNATFDFSNQSASEQDYETFINEVDTRLDAPYLDNDDEYKQASINLTQVSPTSTAPIDKVWISTPCQWRHSRQNP